LNGSQIVRHQRVTHTDIQAIVFGKLYRGNPAVRENAEWNLETALRGASEKVIPVIMTAAVTDFLITPP